MQEEVTGKSVALIVDGARMSEQVLEKAINAYLDARKNKQPKIYHGKQSLKQLARQNAGLANIEITEKNTENRYIRYEVHHNKETGMDSLTPTYAQKATRYYMDEFHLLLKDPQSAAYSVEIWKRFRKWGGIPTGITQNVKDLLASPEIENIFENSDFIYLLNQAAGDRAILCERLNISAKQAGHISNAPPGEGLLFFGNVILPFVDNFPKDNELYSIMTTKPSEVVNLQNE